MILETRRDCEVNRELGELGKSVSACVLRGQVRLPTLTRHLSRDGDRSACATIVADKRGPPLPVQLRQHHNEQS